MMVDIICYDFITHILKSIVDEYPILDLQKSVHGDLIGVYLMNVIDNHIDIIKYLVLQKKKRKNFKGALYYENDDSMSVD